MFGVFSGLNLYKIGQEMAFLACIWIEILCSKIVTSGISGVILKQNRSLARLRYGAELDLFAKQALICVLTVFLHGFLLTRLFYCRQKYGNVIDLHC